MVSSVASAPRGLRAPAALLALSLFCSASWTFALYSGAVDSAGVPGTSAINSATTAVVLVVCALAYHAMGDRAKDASPRPYRIGVVACGAALSCATGAILAASPGQTAAADTLRAGANGLITLLGVLQFCSFAKLERTSAIRASAGAFIAAALAAAILRPSSTVAAALIMLLPLASGIALSAAHAMIASASQKHAGCIACTSATVAARTPNAPQKRRFGRPSRAVFGLCATMFILGFAHDNARIGYLSSIPSSTDATPLAGLVVYALVVTLIVASVTWLQLRRSARHMAACYHMAVLALVASQLLPLLPFDPSTHAAVILPVHMGVYRGMLFFLWVVTLQAQGTNRTMLYCASQAAISLGSFAGIAAWGAAHAARVSDTFFYPLMLLSTLGLLAAYVVFFTDDDLRKLTELAAAGANKETDAAPGSSNADADEAGRGRFSTRCDAVAKQFGLTPRETEIMVMFAKGRNLDYIHNELVISKSTVSMHRQHIYRKLGVHSQQEMIDLIERQEDAE